MSRIFKEFVEEKNQEKGKSETPGLSSKVSLGDNNDFEPFIVSDDPNSQFYGKNKNLAPIIRAFKKGANWGWSKDDGTGEDKPMKIGAKKLFLTGGALRDHLAGKKPRNYELATNCSADEVYHLLTQNKFEFVGDAGDMNTGIDTPQGNGKYTFWVKEKGKKGRPTCFGLKVKNDEYELTLFKKDVDPNAEDDNGGTQSDDAARRDFTINSMYLTLANDNGPNKEITDFFGGMHHLKDGKIAPIGDLGEKLEKDPIRAMRYARMVSKYGDPKKLSEEEKETIRKGSQHLSTLDPKMLVDEFMKGFAGDDTDSRKYIKTHSDLGLLGSLFPGMNLDTKLPKQLGEIGDKHGGLAWMLRNYDPKDLKAQLGDKWKPDVVNKLTFLIKALKMGDNMDPETLDDMTKSYTTSGVSSKVLKQWATKLGGKQDGLIDAFLKHAQTPRVQIQDGDGVTEEFTKFVDPFTHEIARNEAHEHRKNLEWHNFRKQLTFYMPKGS
jgi:tRNA nucleotidyltransferase/poly(A) polymerase